jgi:hypothetical protein
MGIQKNSFTENPYFLPEQKNYRLQYLSIAAFSTHIHMPNDYLILAWFKDPLDIMYTQTDVVGTRLNMTDLERTFYINKRSGTTPFNIFNLIDCYIDPSYFTAAGTRNLIGAIATRDTILYITPLNFVKAE